MSELKKAAFRTVCTQCLLEAQRVETVIEERAYGDMVAVVITKRIFTHIYTDGTRKHCNDVLKHPWLMTLCGMDEIEKARVVARDEMLRFQVSAGMRVF